MPKAWITYINTDQKTHRGLQPWRIVDLFLEGDPRFDIAEAGGMQRHRQGALGMIRLNVTPIDLEAIDQGNRTVDVAGGRLRVEVDIQRREAYLTNKMERDRGAQAGPLAEDIAEAEDLRNQFKAMLEQGA